MGTMKLSDEQIENVHHHGYAVVENFIDEQTLVCAQKALWELFPTPADYFDNPGTHQSYTTSQFAGLRLFPYPNWDLNRLAVYPDLVDAARRICGTDDLDLYKVELWAKYAGAIDYDQSHHFDYGNHSLVVPKNSSRQCQMTTFILLSDVTEEDGPTKLVPKSKSRDIPLVPRQQPKGALQDLEISITGKAGTLLVYRTDVLHRASNFLAPGRSRFIMLVDFQPRGWSWTGKMAWPDHALSPYWVAAMEKMTADERSLFGFPRPGDKYWDEQTLRDVGLRYPLMDMSVYDSLTGVDH